MFVELSYDESDGEKYFWNQDFWKSGRSQLCFIAKEKWAIW